MPQCYSPICGGTWLLRNKCHPRELYFCLMNSSPSSRASLLPLAARYFTLQVTE
jgi:hypothetical protein